MKATPPFSVVLQRAGDHLVLGVHGEFDVVTAPRVDVAIGRAVGDGWTGLVLDLRQVDFMDSAGLHLLLRLRDRVRAGERFEMIGGPAAVERILALAGLSDVLPRTDPSAGHLAAMVFAERVMQARRALDEPAPV